MSHQSASTIAESLSAQDRWEIQDVLSRYAVAIDQRRWDDLRDVFAPEATIDYSMVGRHVGIEAIITMLCSTAERASATQHHLTTSWVWSAGERSAQALTYVTAHHLAPGASQPAAPAHTFSVSGRYDDTLCRGDNGWRITSRILTLATMIGDPSVLGLG